MRNWYDWLSISATFLLVLLRHVWDSTWMALSRRRTSLASRLLLLKWLSCSVIAIFIFIVHVFIHLHLLLLIQFLLLAHYNYCFFKLFDLCNQSLLFLNHLSLFLLQLPNLCFMLFCHLHFKFLFILLEFFQQLICLMLSLVRFFALVFLVWTCDFNLIF